VYFVFQFSHVAPKMMINPQEDLAKSGYKTNREERNLGILLPVGKQGEPTSYIWRFHK
jgi:hypothetical protein